MYQFYQYSGLWTFQIRENIYFYLLIQNFTHPILNIQYSNIHAHTYTETIEMSL